MIDISDCVLRFKPFKPFKPTFIVRIAPLSVMSAHPAQRATDQASGHGEFLMIVLQLRPIRGLIQTVKSHLVRMNFVVTEQQPFALRDAGIRQELTDVVRAPYEGRGEAGLRIPMMPPAYSEMIAPSVPG